MTDKIIKSRIQHKHDTEANWQKATNFIPKSSELIVYDPDENYTYHRFKFGDGVQNVNDLPFSSFSKSYNDLTDKPTIPSKAADIGAVPLTGGTMTGDLKVGSASIGKNGYVVGTWLQGTAVNHMTTAATKICVQDSSGWVYHRTASEILSDIGALPNTTKIPTALAVADDGNGNITLSMG